MDSIFRSQFLSCANHTQMEQQLIQNNISVDATQKAEQAVAVAVAADLEQQILNSKKRKAERKEKKAQKKTKYMETIATKNTKEAQPVKDKQPDPSSSPTCQFYLKKKSRFCNQHPKEGILLLLFKIFKLT